VIAQAGSTLWLLRHDLRLAGRDFRASGRGKSRVVVFVLVANLIFTHLMGFAAAPFFARLHNQFRAETMVGGTLAVAGAFTLFLSKSISEAIEALHQRGDLDLLLSSPIPMRRVLVTRLMAIAVIAAFLPILMVVPMLNGMMLRGYFDWAGVYPVIGSLALAASAAGAALTFGLLAWLGPRWTRFTARALATLFGTVSFLSTQARFLVPDDARSAFWHAVTPAPGVTPWGPQWWPARALLGDAIPMLALALLGIGSVMIVSRGLGQVYGAGVLNNLALSGGVRVAGVARRFRGGTAWAAFRKELLLLLRHPGLGAQVFYQFIFLVPGAIALMKLGDTGGHSPPGVVFLTALMTGRITKILVASPFEADHAAALGATAPVSDRVLRRAKIAVTLLALSVVGGLPLVAIAWRLPHAFPAAFLSCLGAGSTRVWLAISRPKALRKVGLQGRLAVSSDGLLGVMIDIAWGVCGALLTLVI
jgi:ABC-2 type transport system permease protein